jgi:hypothetical protein
MIHQNPPPSCTKSDSRRRNSASNRFASVPWPCMMWRQSSNSLSWFPPSRGEDLGVSLSPLEMISGQRLWHIEALDAIGKPSGRRNARDPRHTLHAHRQLLLYGRPIAAHAGPHHRRVSWVRVTAASPICPFFGKMHSARVHLLQPEGLEEISDVPWAPRLPRASWSPLSSRGR